MCMIFMLMLSLASLSALRGASSQERMAANAYLANSSFQAAEAGLRQAENQLLDNLASYAGVCSGASCNLPASVFDSSITTAPAGWVSLPPSAQSNQMTLWYQISNLGHGATPANMQAVYPGSLYRIVVVAYRGPTRSIIEAVYVHAQIGMSGGPPLSLFQRIMWRQLR